MLLPTILVTALATAPTAFAAVNGQCSVNGVPGVCLATANCKGDGGTSTAGFCPDDPPDVKCCTKSSCGSGGNCRWTSSCSGTTLSGQCPGPNDFKCCVAGGGGGNGGGGGSSTSHELSTHGAEFIAGFEGFRADFYRDAAVSGRSGKPLNLFPLCSHLPPGCQNNRLRSCLSTRFCLQ